MEKHYEVIVVGAGSMGMAAGAYLAKQGRKTLLLDAFDPPHTFGSHHGDTRIIRHAYGEGKQYVPLALRAQQLWNELEEESGLSLFSRTGVLCAGKTGSPFIQEVKDSAEEFALPLEVLQAEEIRYRWPGITVPDEVTGCYEPVSGVLFSEDCIRAYRNMALALGATIVTHTRVERIEILSDGVIVETKEGRYAADSLVVSVGAWANKLLSSVGLPLPLQPTRKTIAWFDADESLYGPNAFPAFLFHLEHEQYYGFPNFNGTGVKVGRHDTGHPVDPDAMNREFGAYPEDEGDVRSFLKRYMPQAAGTLKQGRVCLYTLTPDEHFIIDRHPLHSHVVIAAGFSGHGFKFASAVGEIASEWITTGKTSYDLSMFSLKRFAPVT
ncbi:N-methyl-L-tryptophan oxidase [Brevibacillus sp. H7]|jgi:N-methyl-L-tryptophan oxidase|uniref:N-methyl-L-tryptophan oxidase n=1 Tax=Brevibacillus sp. H7 TaxID=3349138 RepID=UPI00382A3972